MGHKRVLRQKGSLNPKCKHDYVMGWPRKFNLVNGHTLISGGIYSCKRNMYSQCFVLGTPNEINKNKKTRNAFVSFMDLTE